MDSWPPSTRQADTLRVASLNLWGRFGHWPKRLRILAALWPRIDADVLLAQELWSDEGGDQLLDLASELGYEHRARVEAPHEKHGNEGVAVLASRPLGEIEARLLPRSEPLRFLLGASIDHEGHELRLLTSHTVFAPAELTEAQVAVALDYDAERLVLGGDLNMTPEGVAEHAADHGLHDDLAEAGPSWPVSEAEFRGAWSERIGHEPAFPIVSRRLDYMLSRGLECRASGIVALGDEQRGHASDHALVWADYGPGR
jgi:endonuclease/exonuclease/phosphatase family metal-dependent hydrolase